MNQSNIFKFIIFVVIALSLPALVSAADSKRKYGNLNKGIFLIASEKLAYSNLQNSVIYLTQHDRAGTSGIIINRPTNLNINQAFPDTHAPDAHNDTLYFGGPLHTRYLFMLTETKKPQGLHAVNQQIFFGTGEQITLRLREENSTDRFRAFAGFMSWGPQQLVDELDEGLWVMAPGNSEQLFASETEGLWKNLYKRWAGSWI